MKPTNCAGGWIRCRPAKFFCSLILPLIALFSFSYSQTSEAWIIERPEHLVVYDVYQQSLASGQSKVIRPFEPIKVIRVKDFLSDSMTPCAKVEVGSHVYYLLRNERGRLAGSNLLGSVKVFRGVTFVGDTIEVLESGRISFQDPLRKALRFLPAGELCVRYFSAGGFFYVRSIGTKEEYGWLRLSAEEFGRVWKVVQVQPAFESLSPMIRDRVVKRLSQANLAFAELYSFLGKRTNKLIPVPQWRVQSSGSSIVCILLPDSAADQYSRSIQMLSTTLQTYLLGTGYDVVSRGNKIFINR